MVFTLVGKTKGKNVRGVVAGGHHSFFLIDPEEPDILNYEDGPVFTFNKNLNYSRSNLYSKKTLPDFSNIQNTL